MVFVHLHSLSSSALDNSTTAPPYKYFFCLQRYPFNITMHAKDIAIDESSVKVTKANGDVMKIKGFEYGFERDFFIVHLMQPLPLDEDLTIEMK